MFLESLARFFEPLHERRRVLDADPERVRAILEDGNTRARREAAATMDGVRSRIHF